MQKQKMTHYARLHAVLSMQTLETVSVVSENWRNQANCKQIRLLLAASLCVKVTLFWQNCFEQRQGTNSANKTEIEDLEPLNFWSKIQTKGRLSFVIEVILNGNIYGLLHYLSTWFGS